VFWSEHLFTDTKQSRLQFWIHFYLTVGNTDVHTTTCTFIFSSLFRWFRGFYVKTHSSVNSLIRSNILMRRFFVPTSSSAGGGRCNRLSFSSSSLAILPELEQKPRFYPIYVHHVSKTVLQHLQGSHAPWLQEQGLDRGLRVNAKGTFVLHFPSQLHRGDAGRIWCV
jgi:hypothetical protein